MGPLTFTWGFDSGNLQRVERIGDDDTCTASAPSTSSTSSTPSTSTTGTLAAPYSSRVEYEYRLWIRPDCYGTPAQNANRTWFHFGVRGYVPGKQIRLHVVNMNRQSRLYSQGCVPTPLPLSCTPAAPCQISNKHTLHWAHEFWIQCPEGSRGSRVVKIMNYYYFIFICCCCS